MCYDRTMVAFLSLLLSLALPFAQAETGFKTASTVIPMQDGVHLAVTLFMPETLDTREPEERLPVLLEYLPYRKDDYMAMRNYELHSYFAKRGFVTASVDIRGTGSSEGTLVPREYSEQEQLDCLQVLKWLALQKWSNGNVGMFGISWGGFNAIQMAMRQPPELKAIIAVDASDELFHDDIHYIDGMMHIDEFAMSMDLQIGISPAPVFPTDAATLAKRFDQTPWTMMYLQHQRDSQFWRQVSLAPDYSRIKILVFMIGGLYDGYRDSIPRMLANLKVPMKAIIGPWNHTYPHITGIGPAIEWRVDAVRWWNQWLREVDTGITREPAFTVYLRDWYTPSLKADYIPGKWLDLPSWPPANQSGKIFYLGAKHTLAESRSLATTHRLQYVPSVGLDAGLWWGEVTPDQSSTDAQSLVYDSAPQSKPLSILGQPRIKLWVSATAPQANWMVRLTDVAPDGSSSLITGAGMNGSHRKSQAHPEALLSGKIYPLEFDLHMTSWVVPVGHRLRVAVSNALWPMIFPSPYSMSTSLWMGTDTPTQIWLPLTPTDLALHPAFPEPAQYESLPGTSSFGSTWPGVLRSSRDPATQSTTVNWGGKDSTRHPWGVETDSEEMQFHANDLDPARASVKGQSYTEYQLTDRTLKWVVDMSVTSDEKNFYFEYTRRLLQDSKVIRQKTWSETVARDFQ